MENGAKGCEVIISGDRGNHLCNTTCLTHVFFRSDQYFGNFR